MVRQHDVAVVVDSGSCLPADLLCQWGITVAPHELTIDGQSFRDGIDIDPDEFYRRLKSDRGTFSTAAPRPHQFLEAFVQASKQAPNVLCLTLSSNFSLTYQSARAAAVLADSRLGGIRVEVIDSQAAAGASGLIALAAARWASKGYSMEQVITRVNRLIPRVNLLAFLDTLYYLGRSGRVGKLQAWTGTLLGIKPVTELRLGEARVLEKPRSRAKAMNRLLELMGQRVGRLGVIVNVMAADSRQDAQLLLQRIESEFNCRETLLSEFTPVMGAHTGPGLLGVAFYVDEGDFDDSPPEAESQQS